MLQNERTNYIREPHALKLGVGLHRDRTTCSWMFVVPGAIARIMPSSSIFSQAGSSSDLLSLWFTLERMLSRIDARCVIRIGHIQMARGNRHVI